MGTRNKELRIVRIARVVWRRKRLVVWLALVGVLLFGVATFQLLDLSSDVPPPVARSWTDIMASDSLRAVTVPSSISAFRYKGKWRGHEYEVAQRVANELGLRLVVIHAPSEQAMLDSLYAGIADVAIWPVAHSVAANYHGGGPEIPTDLWVAHETDSTELRLATGRIGWLRPCGYRYVQRQVVVHDRNLHIAPADSASYALAVANNSRGALLMADDSISRQPQLLPYYPLMVAADTIATEMLVAHVASGMYTATIADENLAQMLQTYHTNIAIDATIPGSEDTVSWMVSYLSDTLAQHIDSICSYARNKPHYAAITKRYFEQSQGRGASIKFVLGAGKLSVYDEYFRKYAIKCGWDWRLVAAVAYVESRFDPFAESAKGARGLMQLMPTTAERFGCPEALMNDPEASVIAGTNLIANYEAALRNKIARTADSTATDGYQAADSTLQNTIDRDLHKFTIASYNSGLGHVFDAIMLADSLGYDVTRWDGQVERCLELKAYEEYYTLPVVRLGKFPGAVTTDYVREVLNVYADFCQQTSE